MSAHAGDICGDTLAPKSISQPSKHKVTEGKEKIYKLKEFSDESSELINKKHINDNFGTTSQPAWYCADLIGLVYNLQYSFLGTGGRGLYHLSFDQNTIKPSMDACKVR